jgi:hypothetical protein
MSLLADYLTEKELVAELNERFGNSHHGKPRDWRRRLREMRAAGFGPPWARLGIEIVYTLKGAKDWVSSLVQQPPNNKTAHPAKGAPSLSLGRSGDDGGAYTPNPSADRHCPAHHSPGPGRPRKQSRNARIKASRT